MSPAKIPSKPNAKPGKDIIYIDADDEITAVIDKVEAAKNKVVALVLPKRTPVLQSIVNMRLLKRASEEASKNIVLITSETALLPLAGAAGIHVAKNLQSRPEIPPEPSAALPTEASAESAEEGDEEPLRKIDYKRPIGTLASGSALGEDEEETIPLDDEDEAEKEGGTPVAAKSEKPKKVKGMKVPDFDRFRLRLILGALGIIALVIFLILATTVMPKATIAIQTTSSPISASFNLTATTSAKSLDTKKGVIPAVLKTSALSSHQQVKASGQQNNGDKATGTVSVSTICTSAPSPVSAGTGMSSNGLAFITTSTLSFSPSGFDGDGNIICSGSVPVVAQQGGSNYNLPSGSKFTIPGYPNLSGSNSSDFTGGTDNIITILSQQDIDSVKDKISDDDKTKFVQDFEKKLGTDDSLYVLTNTLKSSDPAISASAKAGDQVSSADVTIKITYTILVISKEDLSKAITEHLESQIDKNKQQIGTDDVTKDVTINIQNQTKPNEADLQIIEQTTAIPKIDVNLIKKQIGGQKVGDIRSLIEQWPGVKKVDVKLSPFWVSKAPKNTGKIHIVMTQEKSTNNANNSTNSGT